MAPMGSSTEVQVPRRIARRVMIPMKSSTMLKSSTMFGADAEVEVKCGAFRGGRCEPGSGFGTLTGTSGRSLK